MFTDFELGTIWEVQLSEVPQQKKPAPHVEDVHTLHAQMLATWNRSKLREFILNRFGADLIDPKDLFNELVRFTYNRRWYVAPQSGLPPFSTGFWRFTNALRLFYDTKDSRNPKPRFIYVDDRASFPTFDVPYVGFEEPPEVIPALTLLRFSLSGEYRAGKYNGFWLQLSGWFL